MARERLVYATPEVARRRRLPNGAVVLLVLNWLAGLASVWFLGLAVHIRSCTQSEKVCVLGAIVYGLPMGLIVMVLGAVTAGWLATGWRGRRVLMVMLGVPLLFSAAVLMGLLYAVGRGGR